MTNRSDYLNAAIIYMEDAPWNHRPYEVLGEAARYSKEIFESAKKWHSLMAAIERGEKAIIPKDRLNHHETNSRDIEVVNYENGWNDAINYIKKGIE